MKTKTVLWISALVLLFVGMGCEKDDKVPSELLGTWKLIGSGNTVDNTVKETEPKDCDKCYTITFLKDGILTGFTATNKTHGKYSIQGKQTQVDQFEIMTLVNEIFDGLNNRGCA